jgi:hypothetical protein
MLFIFVVPQAEFASSVRFINLVFVFRKAILPSAFLLNFATSPTSGCAVLCLYYFSLANLDAC